MDAEEMELYPIAHRGKVYNVITALDMTFREVRGMIDWLEDHGAFSPTAEDAFMGPGRLFSCPVEGIVIEVDVQGYDVVVYRRTAGAAGGEA